MKKCSVLLFLLLNMFVPGIAQENYFQTRMEDNLAEAEHHFNSLNYYKSIESYKKVLSDNEGNLSVRLKIAEAYYRLNDAKAAIFWYNSALGSLENRMKVPAEHIFSYAEVLEQNKKYDEALKWFHFYRARVPKDKRATKRIESINSLTTLFTDSTQYEIKWMEFNSPYSDFSPAFYEDGIVFASAREEVSDRKKYNYTNSAFLDLYYSKFQDSVLVDAFQFSSQLNNELHEGSAVFYDEYKKIIFTKNVEYLISLGKDDNAPEELLIHLFYSEKGGDGEWSEPVPLTINERSYSMGHPTVSKNGKVLYFSSNIPGSYGGTDIYKSQWINGAWSSPENLGPEINTIGNEMFPFIFSDSVLYLSSNGHGGLGGLDLFKVSLNKDPRDRYVRNLGYPLNTPNDDFSIILSEDGTTGYFASNRRHEANDDLYQFFIKESSVSATYELPRDVEPEIKKEEPKTLTIAEAKKEEPKAVIITETKKDKVASTIQAEVAVREKKEIYYTVQILALSKPVQRSFPAKLKGAMFRHDYEDGVHRYSYGTYTNSEDAKLLLDQIKAEGYKDAFIRKVDY
jgi:tetratricopeptide (TPR) repeat protein